jgi:hypothetical protein
LPKESDRSICWIVSSTDSVRRTAAGAMLIVSGPIFQVTINPDDDISA